ncbi:hypothetical protein C4J89_5124 [Pseudomonas sp. R4-35-07]|nr:hypothetical protein C4J91_5234 [Pseudomonas sp. R3-52-08]AZF29239.1 hypothetical protein C4J90_5114 [Pseudomonas sp. R2-60-08W]AZF34551.1 hypothetical protein C4J89_5124 [Pseudomonas sp. R4-35-07]
MQADTPPSGASPLPQIRSKKVLPDRFIEGKLRAGFVAGQQL